MKISIITPTFRREMLLAQAIQSVLTLPDWSFEYLIGDDSPERSAEAVVQGMGDGRIKYFPRSLPTGGHPGQIRNDLAQRARGEYLYFLDDDDRVIAPSLAQLVREMETSRRPVAIADVVPFGQDRKAVSHEVEFFAAASATWRRHPTRREVMARLLFKNPILVCSACVIRRDAFLALGGFDDRLTPFEDTDLFLRALRRFDYVYVPVPLLERRCGISSLSGSVAPERIRQCYRGMRATYRRNNSIYEILGLKIKSLNLDP